MPDSAALLTGTYKPSHYGNVDLFPPPAPLLGSHNSALSVFNGATPNGAWRLFVVDDSVTDKGSIDGGWVLTIETVPAIGPASLTGADEADDVDVNVPPDETPSKRPELTVVGANGAGQVRLRVSGLAANTAYVVESSEDLMTWLPVMEGQAEKDEFTVSIDDPARHPHSFFRLRVD